VISVDNMNFPHHNAYVKRIDDLEDEELEEVLARTDNTSNNGNPITRYTPGNFNPTVNHYLTGLPNTLPGRNYLTVNSISDSSNYFLSNPVDDSYATVLPFQYNHFSNDDPIEYRPNNGRTMQEMSEITDTQMVAHTMSRNTSPDPNLRPLTDTEIYQSLLNDRRAEESIQNMTKIIAPVKKRPHQGNLQPQKKICTNDREHIEIKTIHPILGWVLSDEEEYRYKSLDLKRIARLEKMNCVDCKREYFYTDVGKIKHVCSSCCHFKTNVLKNLKMICQTMTGTNVQELS
jgi:hypothetical protein